MHGCFEEEDVVHGVVSSGGCAVVVGVGLGVGGCHLVSTAECCFGRGCFDGAVRLGLSESEGVRCFEEVAEAGAARRGGACCVAHEGYRPRHVEGCPDGDSIAEMLGEDAGVVREVVGEIAIGPASPIFKCLGEVPVIHRAPGADVGGEESVDETAVVIEALRVRGADASGLDARPGDGKTLALLVEALGHGDVLRVEMVLIAGYIACHAASYLSGRVGEFVPDRFAFAVLVPCAFDLV